MSQPVAEEIAVDLAITRVLTQLSAYLSTELTTVALAGLPLPAPDAANFYYCANPALVEKMVSNGRVAVFVYQETGSTVISSESGSLPSDYTEIQDLLITVLIAYSTAIYNPFTMFGKTSTPYDIMARRGARYNAAVHRVMRTRVKGDAGIIGITKENDAFGDYEVADGDEAFPVRGYASSTWIIKQAVTVPDGCEEV